MRTTRKLAIGLSVASGALLAAWFLTGDRGKKAKSYISKRAVTLKNSLKTERTPFDDSEVHYI